MATLIPTHSTGDYLPSSDWNTLTALNNQFGMFAVGGVPLVGSYPAVTAPNFLMQVGFVSGTTNGAGAISFTFPTAFPNGLHSINFHQHVGAGGTPFYFAGYLDAGSSKAGGQAIFYSCTSGGSPTVMATVAASAYYTAIGW